MRSQDTEERSTPLHNILIESAQYSVEPRPLNIFYSSQDIIKDQAEQKAMFSPLQ